MPTTRPPHPAPTEGAAARWARTAPRSARVRERASALVLVPTMLLVLMCLGGLAIDLSLLHGAHRSAHRVVSAAADDAAAMIDTEQLQLTGELRIDPAAAQRVALAQVGTMTLPGRQLGAVRVEVDPDGTTVSVSVAVEVDHVMLRALPGAPDEQRLDVIAHARLNR